MTLDFSDIQANVLRGYRAGHARHFALSVPTTAGSAALVGSIVGLELADGEALLDELWAHATQPELTFRQEWKVGDLMMWDNRCTLHRREAFDPNARRLMHRTQIKGDWAAAA